MQQIYKAIHGASYPIKLPIYISINRHITKFFAFWEWLTSLVKTAVSAITMCLHEVSPILNCVQWTLLGAKKVTQALSF